MIAFGGYQEAFLAVFISAVRKCEARSGLTQAGVFEENPHLLKRYQHCTNLSRPRWERSVSRNVFESLDRALFSKYLTEDERKGLRRLFKSYEPEVTAEKKSKLRPRYLTGDDAIRRGFIALTARCEIDARCRDPGVFCHEARSAILGAMAKNEIGQAAVMADTIFRFLLLDDGGSMFRHSEARNAVLAEVAYIAVAPVSMTGDTRVLGSIVRHLAKLFEQGKDRTIQAQGFLAASVLQRACGERIAFYHHHGGEEAAVVRYLMDYCENAAWEHLSKAVWLVKQSGMSGYFPIGELTAGLASRFVVSSQFEKAGGVAFWAEDKSRVIFGLDQVVDCAAGLLSSAKSMEENNFALVRLYLGIARAYIDDFEHVILTLSKMRDVLVASGIRNHAIWIEWYFCCANLAGRMGLLVAQDMALRHVEELHRNLGAASRVRDLELTRREILEREIAGISKWDGAVSPVLDEVGKGVFGFLHSVPPSLA